MYFVLKLWGGPRRQTTQFKICANKKMAWKEQRIRNNRRLLSQYKSYLDWSSNEDFYFQANIHHLSKQNFQSLLHSQSSL